MTDPPTEPRPQATSRHRATSRSLFGLVLLGLFACEDTDGGSTPGIEESASVTEAGLGSGGSSTSPRPGPSADADGAGGTSPSSPASADGEADPTRDPGDSSDSSDSSDSMGTGVTDGCDGSADPAAPYPGSPVICGLNWADEVYRSAMGSDTWPITADADGTLLSAYGDGRGFASEAPQKLSLGFARVTGAPPRVSGQNIPSPDEQTGDGPAGLKASGMLAANGALLMWMRNADGAGSGCQLAVSYDRAETWSFLWTIDELGYCTWINTAAGSSADEHGYIYTVSPDGASAYEGVDSMVLLRVPEASATDRDAYEFFVDTSAGEPEWSPDIEMRGPVFTNPGRCARSGISYSAGLGRYLWWQQIPEPGIDTRFAGGFGIYDAPTPWGPWTTAYFTESWDEGPGETASFPPAWMSDDGTRLWLLHSGDDAFSLREAHVMRQAR